MLLSVLVFIISFSVTYLFLPILIKALVSKGLVGRDMHKPDDVRVADTGGLAIAVGIVSAMLFAIGWMTFITHDQGATWNVVLLLAASVTVLILEIIGLYDDLFEIRQSVKAVLPMVAAVPLMAIAAGTTTMNLPFIGETDFGPFYVFALIPLGLTVASNLTNMLAGFNGSEAGMGIVMFVTMSILFFAHGQPVPLIISLAMVGSLLAFLRYNWYPAKVFPGDAGTFLIGGVLATVVIIGNMEAAGAILVIPHVIDFFIKAKNRFPKSFALYRHGKLHSPKDRVRGLADVLLKVSGGLTEVQLTTVLIFIETVFASVVLFLYL